MSSEQKDYKTEIINYLRIFSLAWYQPRGLCWDSKNEVIYAVISEHMTRLRWRWYLYGCSSHVFFNKNVIHWPYSDSSAVEVQSLRSGLHKWEFTHAQLTLILPFEWTHQWYELKCLTHFHLPPSFFIPFCQCNLEAEMTTQTCKSELWLLCEMFALTAV